MASIAVKNVLSRAALSSQRGAIMRGNVSSWLTEFAPLAYQQQRTYFSKEQSKSVYEYGAHRSDAEARIDEVPVVMVDGPVALCDGGGGALGHPLDYVYLANPEGKPVACKYCGTRYQMKKH